MPSLMLYGSYGYVGRLAAREADSRDVDLLLAGRDHEKLADQARELDRPARRFGLDDRSTVVEALEDVDCVLNCAGPFSNTAEQLVEGCLRTGTDYVDITGEIPVIERVCRRGDEAAQAGVTLLPSVGFSSVAMDCLAAHLHDRLPEATSLCLGAESFRLPSVGSIKTAIEGIEDAGCIRRNGQLEDVPAAWRTRTIDFGRGDRPAVTMPLGDVSTAYHTTGIPDVEVYAVAPPPARLSLLAHRYAAPVLAAPPVRKTLKRLADLVREGPSERARERGSAYVWGQARSVDDVAVSRLRTPDVYVVTPNAAVTAAERVLAGDADDGYQTPAGAFGAEFVLDLDGVEGFFEEGRPEATA